MKEELKKVEVGDAVYLQFGSSMETFVVKFKSDRGVVLNQAGFPFMRGCVRDYENTYGQVYPLGKASLWQRLLAGPIWPFWGAMIVFGVYLSIILL